MGDRWEFGICSTLGPLILPEKMTHMLVCVGILIRVAGYKGIQMFHLKCMTFPYSIYGDLRFSEFNILCRWPVGKFQMENERINQPKHQIQVGFLHFLKYKNPARGI